MTALDAAPDFTVALEDLQDHLPTWWRSEDPTSQIYDVLAAKGALIDELSVLWEQPFLDQSLATAGENGLRRNFAFAWGLLQEQLPTVAGQLRAYIAARAAENGSEGSLVATLSALIDTDLQGGPVLTFPSGGAGLTFPANGTGLVMYEFAATPGPELVFPSDGSGLVFPGDGSGLTMYDFQPGVLPPEGLAFAADGTGLTFPADGSGLTFGTFTFINLLPNFATYTLTVQVLNYLAFDRAAFARAVARFRPADWLPSVIQEVTQF